MSRIADAISATSGHRAMRSSSVHLRLRFVLGTFGPSSTLDFDSAEQIARLADQHRPCCQDRSIIGCRMSGAALAADCAAAELGRRQAQFVAKAFVDVSDIAEARMRGNIGDRMFRLEQQPLGPLDPGASYFSS